MPTGTTTTSEEWDQLLHRRPLSLDREQTETSLNGKRILITGAGGWIGSALARTITSFSPAHVVLLEASERSLYEIDNALQQSPLEKTSILGSVSDPILLEEIFHRYQPQIVYHAAAFKHVPLMEQNPFAAVENNAIGTNLLVQAALRAGAEQFILLSTDKAVDPVNVMGASKRIAELILLARRTAATAMKAVRLGNVLGSEGSVVPLFRKQILAGGPVTVTHPDAQRFFLPTQDAVTLLLAASAAATAECILVPDLGAPVRMELLARHLIAQDAIPIVFTQLRPGDKLSEALLSARESYAVQRDATTLRGVLSPALPVAVLDLALEQLQRACKERSLKRLLPALKLAVPEYQPSAVMQNGASV